MYQQQQWCALRTARRSSALSQAELAQLLGYRDRTQISRIERGKRVPGIESALASATVFGVSLGELFPELAHRVGTQLRERIARLGEGALQPTSPRARCKREFLALALRRVDELDRFGV